MLEHKKTAENLKLYFGLNQYLSICPAHEMTQWPAPSHNQSCIKLHSQFCQRSFFITFVVTFFGSIWNHRHCPDYWQFFAKILGIRWFLTSNNVLDYFGNHIISLNSPLIWQCEIYLSYLCVPINLQSLEDARMQDNCPTCQMTEEYRGAMCW